MIKICIIGNSHVGALKRAWDKIDDNYRDVDITFFAQRGNGVNGLIVQNGKLVPGNIGLATSLEFTSAGKRDIDIKKFDIFIIYGVGMGGLKSLILQENNFFSKAVMETAMCDLMDTALSFKLLKQVRMLTDKFIFIGHAPLNAANSILSTNYPKAYVEGVNNINQVIYKQLNAELITQPISTIVNGSYTHPGYSKGSKRLAIGDELDDEVHPNSDVKHMNDQFGEIWLREFLNKLPSARLSSFGG